MLALARIWYSVVTGDIVAKDEAASWLMPQLPVEHAGTLQAACSEYLGLTKRTGLNLCRQYNDLCFMQKKRLPICLNRLFNVVGDLIPVYSICMT